MPRSLHSLFDVKQHSKEAAQACAFVIALFVFSVAAYAYGQSVTLNVTVQTALTFVTTNTGFSSGNTALYPGSPLFATTTLVVNTNDPGGWNVTLQGGNKTSSNNNLELTANAASIPDQTEWIPGSATTTAGNAVQISSLTNGGNVLAYRVMTASSTNGVPFLAPTWWGTADNYTTNANTLWAGISSSTVLRQIGYAGTGSYSSSPHVNTVLYYLQVASTQQTGNYTAPLTYTATGN